jgi:hypothetical protein
VSTVRHSARPTLSLYTFFAPNIDDNKSTSSALWDKPSFSRGGRLIINTFRTFLAHQPYSIQGIITTSSNDTAKRLTVATVCDLWAQLLGAAQYCNLQDDDSALFQVAVPILIIRLVKSRRRFSGRLGIIGPKGHGKGDLKFRCKSWSQTL